MPKYQKYKGLDIVQDDSGAYVVFSEQISSQTVMDKQLTPYQLTLKKNWRTLRGCSEFQSQNVQYRLPRHKWLKSWANIEEKVVPLERNQYGHPLTALLWEKAIRGSFVGVWEGATYRIVGNSICSLESRIILFDICG